MIPGRTAARAARRARHRRRRRAVGLGFVAALAALAGMTDAIGFLSVGHFVSFMSGNTTQLAIALGRAETGEALLLAAVLLLYVAGNAFGIVGLWMVGRRQAVLLAFIAGLLALPVVLPARFVAVAATMSSVTAMGLVNAVVERVDGHSFGITYVTGALSRFGRGLGRWMIGDRSDGWTWELVPFTGMILGATCGAFAQLRFGGAAVVLPAGFALLLAAASLAIPRRWRRQYQTPLAKPKRAGSPASA